MLQIALAQGIPNYISKLHLYLIHSICAQMTQKAKNVINSQILLIFIENDLL